MLSLPCHNGFSLLRAPFKVYRYPCGLSNRIAGTRVQPALYSAVFSGFFEDEYEVVLPGHFKLRFSNPAFGRDKLIEAKGPDKRGAPERGHYGAIEVWRGQLAR